MRRPLLVLLLVCAQSARAQTRVSLSAPAPTLSAPVLVSPQAAAPALTLSPLAAPSLAAPSAAVLAPAPLALTPIAAAAVVPVEPAKPDVVAAKAQVRAIADAPDAEALWTGAVPAEKARALLSRSHWETTKFFFGSRSELLRSMVRQQQAETAGKDRAVRDLEGMWLDWRTKAYSGQVRTAGFQVADRATIRREAVKLWDRYFPKDGEARAAFLSYLDRVDRVVPLERPSYYRKKAFGVFYELPTVAPAELAPRMNAMLTEEHLAKISEHRATRQQIVLDAFREGTLRSIADVNKDLPRGKRVIALVLLGSYSIAQSGPTSDIDYQLVTEDGGTAAIKPFADALARNWTENRLKDIEGFASTLPPSPEVVRESFPEGYLVISPDSAAVAALSKSSFAPAQATSWSRLRGRAFGAFWKAWVWSYFRIADLREALKK
ncbi:MAG: hypothetical protein M0D55_18500 [Elusimicrobiota bacterium]|nr:MAG: hypothetical protein M0D55_18500 [Elusimicrobiota bacterium]